MKKIISATLITLISISCANAYMIKGERKEDAIKNIIIDFTKTKNNKIESIYEITELKSSDKLYAFVFNERKWYTPKQSDTINGKTKSFPTSYVEYKKRLYLWHDNDSIISKGLIDVLTKYKLMDSTLIKKERGLFVSEDEFPIIKTDERARYYYYFVCKKNISEYVKVKSNKP